MKSDSRTYQFSVCFRFSFDRNPRVDWREQKMAAHAEKEGAEWEDCLDVFRKGCAAIDTVLVHSEGFSLRDAMQAMEIGDNKTDTGMFPRDAAYLLDEGFKYGRIPHPRGMSSKKIKKWSLRCLMKYQMFKLTSFSLSFSLSLLQRIGSESTSDTL